MIEGVSVVNQDNAETADEKHMRHLLNVGRIIIHNAGSHKASSVEAYIEKIIFDGKLREDFFPMPLVWAHGQLNRLGPTVRDIYPNQTVYLDIINHVYDEYYVHEDSVDFAVAAGHGIDNLSRMNLGESELFIKLYQESGQVDEIRLKAKWKGGVVPTLSFVN